MDFILNHTEKVSKTFMVEHDDLKLFVHVHYGHKMFKTKFELSNIDKTYENDFWV